MNSFEQLKDNKLSAYDGLNLLNPSALHDKEFMFAVSNVFEFDQAASIGHVSTDYVQGK